jgi:hypothetical protein
MSACIVSACLPLLILVLGFCIFMTVDLFHFKTIKLLVENIKAISIAPILEIMLISANSLISLNSLILSTL